jgi:hypothetical protein
MAISEDRVPCMVPEYFSGVPHYSGGAYMLSRQRQLSLRFLV